MTKVAFVGLGKMGQGMAARLLAAGHDVSVYNRTAARAESFARQGARVCGTPKDSAAAGSLTLLAGASEDDLDAARDTLSALCARLIRFGRIGTGTAYS